MENVRVTLTSEYPTVHILAGETVIPKIEAGAAIDIADRLRVTKAGDFELLRGNVVHDEQVFDGLRASDG